MLWRKNFQTPIFTSLIALVCTFVNSKGHIIDFETDAGGIPNDRTLETAWKNGQTLNLTLNSLDSGDTLYFQNKTYFTMGGLIARNLTNVILHIDGTIDFIDDLKDWPKDPTGRVTECFNIKYANNLTITSTGKGLLQGNGQKWWGLPAVGYLVRGEDRPRLMLIESSTKVKLYYKRIFLESS